MKLLYIIRKFRPGSWPRPRVLFICMALSVLLHLFLIFSISPWWLKMAPEVKLKKIKTVALKLKPLAAPVRPPLVVAPRPVEKVSIPKLVYTEEELEEKLAPVRSKEVPDRFARPKEERVKEVMKQKEEEFRKWVEQEYESLEERIEREETGEVGYSRIVDLSELTGYQIGRLMEQFRMSVGYGTRKITDLNIQFTTEWRFTPSQVRNYISRYGGADWRKLQEAVPVDRPVVGLRESGEGPSRLYISPTVAAMKSVLMAEEEYFDSPGDDPEEMESLVFGLDWTLKGPVFKVVQAEKKKPLEELTPPGGEDALQKLKSEPLKPLPVTE